MFALMDYIPLSSYLHANLSTDSINEHTRFSPTARLTLTPAPRPEVYGEPSGKESVCGNLGGVFVGRAYRPPIWAETRVLRTTCGH